MSQHNGDWAYGPQMKADSLFNSPVCEAAYCFFRSLLALAEQTKKRSVTTDDETWNWNRGELQKYTCN